MGQKYRNWLLKRLAHQEKRRLVEKRHHDEIQQLNQEYLIILSEEPKDDKNKCKRK